MVLKIINPDSIFTLAFSLKRFKNFKIKLDMMNSQNEELMCYIEKIKNSNTLVIVEGKKDRIALNKFGIGNIIELSKKPLFQIVEDIANSSD